MPIFRIKDIFRITGRGHVLSGSATEKGIILTGDKALTNEDQEGVVLKIIGVSIQKETGTLDYLSRLKILEN